MRWNLLCKMANMHDFKVLATKSDLPMMKCLRCGLQKPVDRSFTETYLGPGGGGITGLG